MSRSSFHSQLFINDGAGNNLPIQTGTFVTSAINMEERRRLSLTVGILQSTGYGLGLGTPGGFTGTLSIQGTNEVSEALAPSGTPWAYAQSQPGTNGYTGAIFWNTLAGGAVNITNATNSLQIDFTDIGCAYVRVGFNVSATGSTATGTLGGSGTMYLFATSKHT